MIIEDMDSNLLKIVSISADIKINIPRLNKVFGNYYKSTNFEKGVDKLNAKIRNELSQC